MDGLEQFAHGALTYGLPFLVVLSVVVFVHEFGHFWVARRCGVRVETFSIGFGHEIFGWNDKHGTRWKVAWLPLGGYVKMFGDSDPTSATPDEKVKVMTPAEKRVAFFFKPVWQRMAIVFAGPASNYLFAILVLAGLFIANGQPYTAPVVDKVLAGSVAEKVGFMTGDRVVRIDDADIASFEDIRRIVSLNVGTPINVAIERDGQPMVIAATPEVVPMVDRFGGEHKLGRLGFSSSTMSYRELSVMAALGQSVIQTWNLTAGTLQSVGQMIMGMRGTEELGGPLRIAEMSGNVAKEGIPPLIWLMAVISINLGLINLFPIPLLDGGHLLFYLAEALRGKPLSERMQENSAKVGAALVLSLMVFATWNDLMHLGVITFIKGIFS